MLYLNAIMAIKHIDVCRTDVWYLLPTTSFTIETVCDLGVVSLFSLNKMCTRTKDDLCVAYTIYDASTEKYYLFLSWP